MGKFDGKFFHGTIGPAVFKKYRDMQVVQGKSKKKKTQLTPATKKAATVFGKASNLASCIRETLSATITNFYDGTMVYRFTTDVVFAIRTALNPVTQHFNFMADSFSRLDGFEFNLNSPLRNIFFVQPEVSFTDDAVQVNIPEMHIPQDFKFPHDLKYCKMILTAGFFDLENGHYQRSDTQIFDISYEYMPVIFPPQQCTFEKVAGCLTVIGISLQYYVKTFAGNAVVNTKAFNPSAVLKAFITDGVPDISITGQWPAMAFKA